MALETGDVTKVDPNPPPIAGDDASPEVTTSYRDPNVPDPRLSPVPSIAASLTPDVPDVPGGSYGNLPVATTDAGDQSVATELTLPFMPPGMTPQQAETFRQQGMTILDEQIGARAAAQRQLERRDREFEARMERLNSAIGHGLDNMQPWNADREMAARKHDLWEEFGSPGFLIAMLGSAFTAMPMVSALNGGAAAMNAINQGDLDGYDKAFDAWKQNTELVLKRMRTEEDMFNNVDKLRSSNYTRWKEELALKMDQYGDRRKKALLEAGMDEDVIKSYESLEKLRGQIENNYQAHLENKALFDEVQRQLPLNKGNWFAAYTAALEKLNLAKNAGRYGQTLTAQQTAEIARRDAAYLAANPKKDDESDEDFEKRRQVTHDAHVSEVLTPYKPLEAKRLNLAEWKAQKDEEHKQFMENLASRKMTLEEAKAQENEKHKQIDDDIKAGRLAKEITAEAEKERHDRVWEELQKFAKTQLTANKSAELRVATDRYTTGIETIDKIVALIKKHVGSVGVAGYATRAAESMSNVLSGSKESDRRELERLLNELQMIAPRLITESTARPMASEHEHVNKVVGGLGPGDTRPNVLRNMEDLRSQLSRMKSNLEDIIMGKPFEPDKPADKTEQPDSKPEWTRGVPTGTP